MPRGRQLWELKQSLDNQRVSADATTDHSGTLASGAAQDAMPANASRRFFFIQNNSDTDMWFNYGVDAVASQPSILLPAGTTYENPPHFCPTGRISVIGGAGKSYTAKEA